MKNELVVRNPITKTHVQLSDSFIGQLTELLLKEKEIKSYEISNHSYGTRETLSFRVEDKDVTVWIST